MAMKRRIDFTESYIVRFDTKQPDGFWKMNCEEVVVLSLSEYPNEKDNHEIAMKIIEKKFPNCKVTSVTYA